jgi:hypothetical protein
MWRNLFNPQFRNWHWAFCFLVGLYVQLFVKAFEPFKSNLLTYVWASQRDYINHSIIDFFLTVFGCALLMIILPKYFPKFFAAENLTFQRYTFVILLTTLFVEIEFLITCSYFFKFDITPIIFFSHLSKITLPILLFTVIPFATTTVLTMRSYILDKKYKAFTEFIDIETTQNREQINPSLELGTPQYMERNGIPNIEKPDLQPIMLKINDNSNKKDLEIPLNSLYYITSDHNYVEVHYQNKNAVNTRHILRNSLKAIEEEIMNNSDLPLIRCHKAFIINTEKVEELRGSSKSAHFILSGIEMPIPISRQKYSELETRFLNLAA